MTKENSAETADSLRPSDLVELYKSGVNISKFLRSREGSDINSPFTIEMAYELQAGSYVEAMRDPVVYDFKVRYAGLIAQEIQALGTFESVLEVGVGEATTLGFVAGNLPADTACYGFDISWSRVAVAREWLEEIDVQGVQMCTADLSAMPYADDSIDVVYTSHSIEPNGGREKEILSELYRVARHYLVLLEPDYENASEEARARMREHGYCRYLAQAATELGMEVVRHEPFPHSINPMNPTGLTIIRKPPSGTAAPADVYVCPVSRGALVKVDGAYFSPDSLLAYPVIDGIPCLREANAIVCCHLASKGRE